MDWGTADVRPDSSVSLRTQQDLVPKGRRYIILRGDKPLNSEERINDLKSADLLRESAKVRFGVILTGEKLLDSLDFRDQLRNFVAEAIGGEMEAWGSMSPARIKRRHTISRMMAQ